MATPKDPFVMFVSSVPGRLVARYGAGPHALIGARHGKDGPEWQPEVVAALTAVEVARYGREYRRALADGGLKTRTRADYDAYVKAEDEAHKKALKKQQDDAAAAAKKAQAEAAAPAEEK